MIIAYVGTPGSGKSYEAVCKVLDNLKTGRIILTNVDGMDNDKSREHIKNNTGLTDSQLSHQLRKITDEQCLRFWEHIEDKGVLVVIDEAHKLFSNRDWSSDTNKIFTEWASTHRHGGHDVILITQDIEKIDKHARSLIEWTYFFRKVNYFGSLVQNKYIRYSYDSDNHKGKPLHTEKLTYSKKIFPCYSSYDANDIKELGIQKNYNVLKHPVFISMPFIFALTLFFVFKSSIFTGDVMGSKSIAERSSKISSVIIPGQDKTKPEFRPVVGQTSPDLASAISSSIENGDLMVPGAVYSPTDKPRETATVLYIFSDGTMYATNSGRIPESKDGVQIVETIFI